MILRIILRMFLHNAVELQEILNRIMQRIMSIITSALHINAEPRSTAAVQSSKVTNKLVKHDFFETKPC